MHFSHLHTHTQFSLLDGAASIKELFNKAEADEQKAVAITDHGNMFGVFRFVAEAWARKDANGKPKVKPIIGCEFYLVEDRHQKNFTREKKDKRYHQLLLAKDRQGYENLMKLCSLGYIEGLYGKFPRIDKALIQQYHEGLIATSCCIGAEIPQTILNRGEEAAEEKLKWWLDVFGDDFYLEVQRHGMPEEEQVNQTILKFGQKYNIPVIATNDSHYVEQEDFDAHDILLCINTGRKIQEPVLKDFNVGEDVNRKDYRFGFFNDQFYFKTQSEMAEVFKDIPHAVDNTQQIVDKVECLNLERDVLLPNFPIPAGFADQDAYLEHLTWEGARRRYSEMTPEIEERIRYELSIIKTMGFAGYFLIVSDFINYGKSNGVVVGPGRGSAAGSVVAYCTEITNIDPIKYRLIFERFLNPDRNEMPDIDTDFDDYGRQKVIDYVVDKYSKEQVAQIVTFGTMAAKMSIKDVARVMDVPLAQSNALVGLLPQGSGYTLQEVLHAEDLMENEAYETWNKSNVQQLRKIYKGTSPESKVLQEAERLEGSVRNTGIHAAGIIITPQDLKELIPVCITGDSDQYVTQYDGKTIEKAGGLKMDFLGLKTLSILRDCLEIVKEIYGEDINLDDLPFDDVATFELYQRGETNGIFQFESPGMQKYLKQLQPDKLEDLIAMNALYRPGPMDYIPDFIKRKKGEQEIHYDLEGSDEYLEETYGVTVYQEQVMQLAMKIAGFEAKDADKLRKAMGKKDMSTLEKLKDSFMKGGTENGYPAKKLEKVWKDWESFAKYAFNKSHSTCYAIVSYYTAYLKANYPSAFLASLLNHAGSADKISFFLAEAKRLNIKVLGPDINESYEKFFVNKNDEIRFGLEGIKGVGQAAISCIMEERKARGKFENIFDFVSRVPLKTVNKKSLENLAATGCFDEVDEFHRGQYLGDETQGKEGGLEQLIRYGKSRQDDSQANSLFGEMEQLEILSPTMPAIPEWSDKYLLSKEKELMGLYISGHPLEKHRFIIDHYGISSIDDVLEEIKEIEMHFAKVKMEEELSDANWKYKIKNHPKRHRKILVQVDNYSERETRKGDLFAIFGVSDLEAETSLALFGEQYYNYHKYLKPDSVVLVDVMIEDDYRTLGSFRMSPFRVTPVAEVIEQRTKKLILNVDLEAIEDGLNAMLAEFHRKDKEHAKLIINLTDAENKLVLESYAGSMMMDLELGEYLVENPRVDFEIVSS